MCTSQSFKLYLMICPTNAIGIVCCFEYLTDQNSWYVKKAQITAQMQCFWKGRAVELQKKIRHTRRVYVYTEQNICCLIYQGTLRGCIQLFVSLCVSCISLIFSTPLFLTTLLSAPFLSSVSLPSLPVFSSSCHSLDVFFICAKEIHQCGEDKVLLNQTRTEQ